jgi:hypothetical protein
MDAKDGFGLEKRRTSLPNIFHRCEVLHHQKVQRRQSDPTAVTFQKAQFGVRGHLDAFDVDTGSASGAATRF